MISIRNTNNGQQSRNVSFQFSWCFFVIVICKLSLSEGEEMLWCYFPSLGTLVQEMRYANYPSSVASPPSHSPMVVFLPGRQYKLFQDGSANGPRKCISLASSPTSLSVLRMTLASSLFATRFLTFLIPMMTSPSMIPVTPCDPRWPRPGVKS